MRPTLLGFLIIVLITGHAEAQTPFFQGKTIRVAVGYLAGDTHDLWARAYARNLGKHLPGNPEVIVQNMPGAGWMIAANYVYNVAKPDGLTLGSINRGSGVRWLRLLAHRIHAGSCPGPDQNVA